MKKLYLLIISFCLLNCAPEEILNQPQDNVVMQAITNGKWKVSSFIKGSSDITSEFSSYTFQFKNNFTVDALKNGNIENTGTWLANAIEKTIISNFPIASHPLNLLNGTFNIDSTTWTSVDARLIENGESRTLKLIKI